MLKFESGALRAARLGCAIALAALCLPAQALVLLNEEMPGRPGSFDHRPGTLRPAAPALAKVAALRASASWNRFGTVNSLFRPAGFLGEGYEGEPVAAARQWIRDNKELFKLSDAGVDDLEVVNDGRMPANPAHAVLFRQTFGGLHVTHDGLITVGIAGGKVYYASSSSAGDQPPAGPVVLTPIQGWLRAAANLGLNIPADLVRSNVDATATRGWHLFQIAGFSGTQRARLVAIPMPEGGVRQAYEANVVNRISGSLIGYVFFVDAETGQVLRREDRVNWQAAGTDVTPFFGTFAAADPDQPDAPVCGPRHALTLATDRKEVLVQVVPLEISGIDEYSIDLYAGDSTESIAHYEFGLSVPNQLDYRPQSGVIPAGDYAVQVCSLAPAPPSAYTGLIVASETGVVDSVTGPAPTWRWNPSTPPLDYADDDLREKGCWVAGPGCQAIFSTGASPYAWDMIPTLGNLSTRTTIGNNAVTAQAWLSVIAPAENYRPIAPTRQYDFPFTNAWAKSQCSPANLIPHGNDIDASVTNLFVAHNRMHDWAYLLGFTEQNYNLQLSNFGLTSPQRENDPELGNAQSGAIVGSPEIPVHISLAAGRDNSNQLTLQDGVPGDTNQYLWQPMAGIFYGRCADGDFDMGVIGHEYTHAISGRMVGGPDEGWGIGDQAAAMNESNGDLDALEYMHANGYLTDDDPSHGALAPYATSDSRRGIRNYPIFDSPLNYSDIGFDVTGPEGHADGDIWNATQWALRQALIDAHEDDFPYEDRARQQACADGKYPADACPGNRRWIQLLFDSWLLLPGTATMLDARDALLAADVARFGGENQKAMWHVFAARGMGAGAWSAGADDTAPIASFDSPLEPNAEVTFSVTGEDGKAVAAKIFVGDYSARVRPVADTDPATTVDSTDANTAHATANTTEHASIVPGTYTFMVQAPGYGVHRFTGVKLAAGGRKLRFTLPTNFASLANGASVAISATKDVNQAAKDTLIDDDEGTGIRFHDAAPITDGYALIALAGGAHRISRVNVSTIITPGGGDGFVINGDAPNNSGRLIGLRKFELRVCTGACTDPAKDFDTVAYTSPDDAFPAGYPRPLQPDMALRSFSFAPVTATHVLLRVLTNQCTGQPVYQGDLDGDPLNNPDCVGFTPKATDVDVVSAVLAAAEGAPLALYLPPPPAAAVRAAEIEVFDAPAKASVSGSADSIEKTEGNSNGRGLFLGAFAPGALLPLLLLALRRRARRG